MAVGDAHRFPSFLTPVLTHLSFQSYQLLSLHASCRGERRKYAGKKVRLNQVSNSQPPGHESDTLTTEPPGRATDDDDDDDHDYDDNCHSDQHGNVPHIQFLTNV